MSRARTLTVMAAMSVAVLLLPAPPAQAAPPYPAALPDFSHAGSPHDSGLEFYGAGLYSPVGGGLDRPMLVAYLRFSDVTAPSFVNAGWVANRFFGPFPSVANYFADDSFGRLLLTAAPETNVLDGGMINDGVVTLDMGDSSTFFAQSERLRNRAAVQAADANGVDFSAFDTNGDGTINDSELVFHVLEESANATGGGGITRDVEPGTTVDGKNVRFLVAMDNTSTNLMTIIHETGHVAFHMRDLYGFGVGSLDISGPTIGPADPFFFRTNAWQRMHLGWSAPVVVTRDGFVEINNAALAGEGFILYDPDQGTDRYYMVEHRSRGDAADYDQNAADTGLVIWRVDDAHYNSGDPHIRPIEIRRPDGFQAPICAGGCYGGSNTDAWNPSDPATPQRTFDEDWFPNVAVRAINAPRSDGVVRAFFDVRGAGVLVDPNTAQGAPMTVNVTPQEANQITFPVMNTGDDLDGNGPMSPTDTFDFSLTTLPTGWTTTTDTKTLGGHEGATATVQLTPEANAPTGNLQIAALGRSQTDATIVESAPFTVNVVLDRTEISYTGATARPWGETADFRAVVRNLDDPGTPPIPGQTVTFELSDASGPVLTTTAATDTLGVAQVAPTLSLAPGTYTLRVSVPRLGKHAAAEITRTYTVQRRATTLTYTGDTSGQYSDPSTVSARLTDTLSGAPLSGLPLTLSLGTQSAPGTTDGDGRASTVITIDQPSGTVSAGASFAGDPLYLPDTVSQSFSIAKEVLSFAYTGDTLTESPAVPTLRSSATQQADGSPGNVALAEARFDLTPTLGSTAFDYTTGVDAAGLSSTSAAGLPVDLWNVAVSVPAANPYWTGASASTAELALFDPARNVTGDARGPDGGGSTVRAKLENLQYLAGAWHNRTRLDGSFGRFVGEMYDWVIAVGNQAILQVDGTVGATPTTLRLRLTDIGSSGDTFRGVVTGLATTYDSALVTASQGNLRVQ